MMVETLVATPDPDPEPIVPADPQYKRTVLHKYSGLNAEAQRKLGKEPVSHDFDNEDACKCGPDIMEWRPVEFIKYNEETKRNEVAEFYRWVKVN